MRKIKVTPKSRYAFTYSKCDLCKKTSKLNETILSFGDGAYIVHVPCLEEFLFDDTNTVKEHKENKAKQKEEAIEAEFDRIRQQYIDSNA